jgi:hypothetical protein
MVKGGGVPPFVGKTTVDVPPFGEGEMVKGDIPFSEGESFPTFLSEGVGFPTFLSKGEGTSTF